MAIPRVKPSKKGIDLGRIMEGPPFPRKSEPEPRAKKPEKK